MAAVNESTLSTVGISRDIFSRRLPAAVIFAIALLTLGGCGGGTDDSPEPGADSAKTSRAPAHGTIDTTAAAESPGSSGQGFGGYWSWSNDRDGLTLSLTQSGSKISGHHEAWTQYGDKVDIVDEDDISSISGAIKGNRAMVDFRSGASGTTGKATLTRTGDVLQWEVASVGDGECYIPKKAMLRRGEPEEEERPELDEGASVRREERAMRPAATEGERARERKPDAGTGTTVPDRDNSGGGD